jgi:hypothetical protein
MKKIAILSAVFSALFVFPSCEKVEEPVAVNVIESAGTATISGFAYADLSTNFSDTLVLDDNDPFNDFLPVLEFAPAGTKLYVVINPNSFPGASTYEGNEEKLIYTATVGTDGKWSTTIKAPKKPVTATISADPFRVNFVNYVDTIEVKNAIYNAIDNNRSVSVWSGNVSLEDFYWTREN